MLYILYTYLSLVIASLFARLDRRDLDSDIWLLTNMLQTCAVLSDVLRDVKSAAYAIVDTYTRHPITCDA